MPSRPAGAISYRGKTTAPRIANQGVGHKTRHPSHRYVDWRTQRLLDAGFDESDASRLGEDSSYDLHALLELVDRGCPPALAVRILAPLDGEPPWE
jgi:hypothetical protein